MFYVAQGIARSAVFAMTLVLVLLAAPAAAQEQGIRVVLSPGNCRDKSTGNEQEVAILTVLARQPLGLDSAADVASGIGSVSAGPQELPALSGRFDYLAPGGKRIACGEIDGTIDDGGALLVGITDLDDSGITGIAYLGPVPDPQAGWIVSFFATGDDLARIAAPVVNPAGADPAAESTAPQRLAYLNGVNESRETVAYAASTLSQNVADGITQENLQQTIMAVAIFTVNLEDAQALVPPAGLEDLHAQHVSSLEGLNTAGLAILDGIGQGDSSAILARMDSLALAVATFASLQDPINIEIEANS